MALLLCSKRGGVQLAAYFSKSSSSSSTSSTLISRSRSLAESKRVGRWAVGGAVRGYTEDASSSNSSLSDQTQKMLQREVEMLRNELKESSERMQSQFEKLRGEIEEKIKKPPPTLEEELRSEIIRGYTEDASSLSNNQMMMMIQKMQQQQQQEHHISALQLEIEKLRNENEKRIKESSSSEKLIRSAETRYAVDGNKKTGTGVTIAIIIFMYLSYALGSALGDHQLSQQQQRRKSRV